VSIEIYTQVGLELAKVGSQLLGECPFCGKTKFYVDPNTTKYDCKVCGEHGNDSTIVGRLATEVWRPALTDEHVAALSRYRKGLPEDSFWLTETLGWNEARECYVWTVRMADGRVRGYRYFTIPKKGKNAIHNSGGGKTGLLGSELLAVPERKNETVYMTEGEWDFHATIWLLMVVRQDGIVISVPGAGVLPDQILGDLAGRNIVLLYDNDQAGQNGCYSAWSKLKASARSVKCLHWTKEKKDGYDLSDLVMENVRKPKDAFGYIQAQTKDKPAKEPPAVAARQAAINAKQADQEKLTPATVEELHAVYKRWLCLENTDLLDVAMGCLWTCHLPGNPIWLFIVSPPSSSKSEVLVPVSDWWRCYALSNVSSKGLVSGFAGQAGSDPSLLAKMDGVPGALIVKDLTPLIQSNPVERDEVFGILRDAYDGSCSKDFGNGLRREYKKLNFAILAGVTPAIDAMSHVAMGERFLKFRPDKETRRADEEARAIRAIQNTSILEKMREELRDISVRCLLRPFDKERVPSPDPEAMEFLARLAQLTAWMRGTTLMDERSGKSIAAPMVEACPRLAIQFVKLSQGIALHLGVDSISDQRVKSLIRRVALHTGDAITIHVFQTIWRIGVPTNKKEVVRILRTYNFTTVSAVFDKMVAIDLISRVGDIEYRVSEDAARLVESTKLFDGLPRSDPFWKA
jgi:hypothetical protein